MPSKTVTLNPNESKLLRRFTDGKEHTIAEFKALFTKEAKKRLNAHYEGWTAEDVDIMAQSYVRNALRKLVRLGLCRQTDRGTYRATPKGRRAKAA